MISLHFRHFFISLCLLTSLSSFTLSAKSVELVSAATPLLRLTNQEATHLDPDWKKNICQLRPLNCQNKEVALYRTKYTRRDPVKIELYWLITSAPAIALLQLENSGKWELKNYWDFTHYSHSMTAQTSDDPKPIEIYPALYYIRPQQAVALMRKFSEGYSGGGAGFSYVDFVPILPAKPSNAYHPVFSSVPFSCEKMVRACFSEKEYKTSPHCHDEYTGWLTIEQDGSINQDSSINAEPAWKLTWYERYWPAHVSKKRETHQRTTVIVHPKQDPAAIAAELAKFPFCGGGPVALQ